MGSQVGLRPLICRGRDRRVTSPERQALCRWVGAAGIAGRRIKGNIKEREKRALFQDDDCSALASMVAGPADSLG